MPDLSITSAFNQATSGQYGATTFTSTTARTGNWFAFTVINDTVFTTLTESDHDGDSAVTGITYSAGQTIFGTFTAITLASGKIRAYKAV